MLLIRDQVMSIQSSRFFVAAGLADLPAALGAAV